MIKEKKIKKEKALPPITENEIPFDLPEGWVWCRIGDVYNSFLGGFAYKSNKFLEDSKYQVLRLGNVKNDKIRFSSNPVFISESYARESDGYKLYSNDILITMTGTRAKKDYCFTALLNNNHFKDRELFLNQRVGCFRFNNNCSYSYLNYVLKCDLILEPIFEKATGTANQANVGKGAIVESLIPIPPKKEQELIAKKLDSLIELSEKLKKEIQNSQQQIESLMQSVLKEVYI